MKYTGKLYGKIGNNYVQLARHSDDVDAKDELLAEAKSVLARMRRSMTAHPDHEPDSEFEGFADAAQEMEDKIEKHLNQ